MISEFWRTSEASAPSCSAASSTLASLPGSAAEGATASAGAVGCPDAGLAAAIESGTGAPKGKHMPCRMQSSAVHSF